MIIENIQIDKSRKELIKGKPDFSYLPVRQKNSNVLWFYTQGIYINDCTRGPKADALRISRKVYKKQVVDQPIKNRLVSISISHKLSILYDIPNKQEVDNFLVKYPKLMDFADRAFKQIRKYFSSEVLSLEVTRDPEVSDYEQLCVYIHTSVTVKEAIRKLNEFDDQWLLDHLVETDNLLSFNLRFL